MNSIVSITTVDDQITLVTVTVADDDLTNLQLVLTPNLVNGSVLTRDFDNTQSGCRNVSASRGVNCTLQPLLYFCYEEGLGELSLTRFATSIAVRKT